VAYWFDDSRAKTIAFDAMHVMLFYGERYMTRTVAECAKASDSRGIRATAQAFVEQEMQHALAHKAFWPQIAADLTPLHHFYRWLGDVALMRLPRTLRLAITLGIEHNTASFAEAALAHRALAAADKEPRRLLEWHCAEEIEHKHAVFLVLDDAIAAPFGRYALRLLGMALAVIVLGLAHAIGMALLWRQDRARHVGRDLVDLVALLFTKEALIPRGVAAGWRYLLPRYRPVLDRSARALAEHTLGRPLAFPPYGASVS
jgi:predicted metal-dependent hydrolase